MSDIQDKRKGAAFNGTALDGVFAPMVTPFEDDKILFDGLIRNVEKMNSSRLKGYFVLGTNGEYKSLSVPEREKVLKTVIERRARGKVIMAGTGAESTKETIDLTLGAADLGADMVSLLMPHFFAKKIDDDVLISFILEVAEASPVPVVLYNNPSVAAGVTISSEVIRRVGGHPNIIGIKDSSKASYKDSLSVAVPGFAVMAGSANFFLEVMKLGGSGGVLSLANIYPDECSRLHRAFREGNEAEVEELNDKLIILNKSVSGNYSVAGVKAAMDIVGYVGGVPRRPIKGLTLEQRESLAAELKQKGFKA